MGLFIAENHFLTPFAAACYETNTITELWAALVQRGADRTDCRAWKITPTEWRTAIGQALAAKRADATTPKGN